MRRFDDCIEIYKNEMKGLSIWIDEALLKSVTKACGPSIYNPDSSKVSSSDQSELDRVKNNFLIKKLGLADGPTLDAAIKEVVEKLGQSNRNKYRAIFYYLLVQKFGKESMFS